jgi:hypothetical protein
MNGITTLMLAAKNGDADILRRILNRKAKINAQDKDGETALMYAARAGQTDSARLLLSAGAAIPLADSHRWTALTYAIVTGHPDLVTLLIAKGADVNLKDDAGRTPLMIAALYGRQPAVMRELLAHGADPRATDGQGRTAQLLAESRGSAECVQALRGTDMVATSEPSLPAVTPRAAVTRSLALLQRTNAAFAKKAGCISCHHEGLGLMATAVAQERGFAIDTALAQETLKRVYSEQAKAYPLIKKAPADPATARQLPLAEIGELTPGLSFLLSGLVAHRWPADEKLAALAQILATQQAQDGHWQFILPRVPVQSSCFTVTALSLRILQTYMPWEKAAETARRIARAREWLLNTPARDTEDRTFRLLGLQWAEAARKSGRRRLRSCAQRSVPMAGRPSCRRCAAMPMPPDRRSTRSIPRATFRRPIRLGSAGCGSCSRCRMRTAPGM